MVNSNFSNSSGINDPNNYSTVRDILIMSNYLIKEHPEFYEYFKEKNLHGKELVVIQSLKEIETLYYTKILEQMVLKQAI